MKDTKRFRGCLKEFSLDETITQSKIDYLLKKNIITNFTGDYNQLDDYDKEHYNKAENDVYFNLYFFYNKCEYCFNSAIMCDIYDIIIECIRLKTFKEVSEKETEIEISCRSILEKSSKIKYLKEYYKNLFKDPARFQNYQVFTDRERNIALFQIISDDYKFGMDLVKFYLQEEKMKRLNPSYDSKVLKTFLNKKNPFIDRWILFYKTKKLENFVLDKIKQIETKNSKNTKYQKRKKIILNQKTNKPFTKYFL